MRVLRAAAFVTAALVALAIILVVVIPYVFIIRMIGYNARFCSARCAPHTNISDVYPQLKTGDLLFFVAALHMPSNSGLAQTFFSHVAFLVQDRGRVYTSETQRGTRLMPGPAGDRRMRVGADVAPLLVRLKYYVGSCYVARLSRALDPGREALVKAEVARLCATEHSYPSLAQSAVALALGTKTRGRHCFQHVAHLLDVAGLTPLDREGRPPLEDSGVLQVCREVCGYPGRPLRDDYRYAEAVQIMYDIDSQDGAPY